ncbi:uncharacterized protein AKAW2_30021A [Aspergillus luchuensis]|uniref:Uncharacterized protein n=1 Tax=Aspergillus kawachii TaxID=1069201 RepID=A0A7R7W5F0_ASPKA|nr:uncharacterized protein AKAW2_30021A [Aspergillus luchuensis]BCR96702.1 hypothetical protein AKAW2_30021A [Aspergillus luchuensis]
MLGFKLIVAWLGIGIVMFGTISGSPIPLSKHKEASIHRLDGRRPGKPDPMVRCRVYRWSRSRLYRSHRRSI